MTTNQILSISPQGQITIPVSWRKSLKLGKKKELLASFKMVNGNATMTLIEKPTSWADFVANLDQKAWKNIDIEKYIEQERNSWT